LLGKLSVGKGERDFKPSAYLAPGRAVISATVKRIIKYGFYAFVLISLGIAVREYLSGGAVLAALGAFNWPYAPLVLGLTVVYLLLKGARFGVFLNPLVEYGRWAVLRAYLAG